MESRGRREEGGVGGEYRRGGEKCELHISKCVGDKEKRRRVKMTEQQTESTKTAVNAQKGRKIKENDNFLMLFDAPELEEWNHLDFSHNTTFITAFVINFSQTFYSFYYFLCNFQNHKCDNIIPNPD